MANCAVIIPVYNLQDCLAQTLASIMEAGDERLRIYLVDDGSADASLAICQDFASKHSNVTVLSQANAGPSAARNAALDICQEEYITFVDGDDILAPATFSQNLDLLEDHPEIDILFYPICKVHDDGTETAEVDYGSQLRILSGEEVWEKWCVGNKSIPGYFWGKIYRSHLFEHARAPIQHRFAEDMFLLSELLDKANTIAFSHLGKYGYVEREGAATQTPWTEAKAIGIASAYFHRWKIAKQSARSLSSQVNAWALAIAEITAERKRFLSILSEELMFLIKKRPTLFQLLKFSKGLKGKIGALRLWIAIV